MTDAELEALRARLARVRTEPEYDNRTLEGMRAQLARVQGLAETFRSLAASQLDEVVRLRALEAELWEARTEVGNLRAQLEAAQEAAKSPAQLYHVARRLKGALVQCRALVHEWRSTPSPREAAVALARCADALEAVLDHAL